MVEILDVPTHDKIARLSPPYKQLLNFISVGIKEEEWGRRLRATPEQLEAAIKFLSEVLGVSSSDRKKRLQGIENVGRVFFRVPSDKEEKIAFAEDFKFPPIEELLAGIRRLSENRRAKILAVARSKYGQYDEEADKLGISAGTLKSMIPVLCKEIGFLPLQKKNFAKKRHEHLQKAVKQMEELKPEPA
jgi:hypothetical protein